MIIFGGTCSDCDFNDSCSHQKLLWDGKQFKLVPAVCRATDGSTYYHKGYTDIISEPMDWFLWASTKKRGLIIYGREQFIRSDSSNNNSCSDPTPNRVVVQEVVKKVGPLKSVYADLSQAQQDLF